MKKTATLYMIKVKVAFRNLWEYIQEVLRYYSNPIFRKVDLRLQSCYLFKSPFHLSRDFVQNMEEEDRYIYGETPLRIWETIVQKCGITKEDCVFDMGAGQARTCFWLHAFIGCRTVGIDLIPEFMDYAEKVRAKYELEEMEFRNEDLLDTNLTGATVLYLYSTAFTDELVTSLTKRFCSLPPGTKIITVSFPLELYTKEDAFEVLSRFRVSFTWGEGDVFLQIKK